MSGKSLMRNIKKNGKKNKTAVKEISLGKKRLFYTLTIFLPFIFILFVEILLNIINYGGNRELFIAGPEGYEEYLRCNPEVTRRYFYLQEKVPTPPIQLFLKNKPANSFRIFVLGESSAAGFPYSNNSAFPNVLQRKLGETFPDKKIEVVNISFSAINTYTLLDLTDEIIENSPDLILIYTGHNEYYGAMGVGSVQSIGNNRWLIKSYLKLQKFKSVILLRDIIGWFKISIGKIFYGSSENNPSSSLMSQMAQEQEIIYKSELYESGKEQFTENMKEIIEKFQEKKIKVVLSELVSNLKDQKPFVSVKGNNANSAEYYYLKGKEFEKKSDFKTAEDFYIKAKDYDALRFRAPEEFNEIIINLAKNYSTPLVPMKEYFRQESENGIIGGKLILEHLHPNIDGYCLMAKAFYETLRDEKILSNNWQDSVFYSYKNDAVTELDSIYGKMIIDDLTQGWPFKQKGSAVNFMQTFVPKNKIEEIAFKILPSDNYNLEAGHLDLAKYYESKGENEKALKEYKALIASLPVETEFYKQAAIVYINLENYDEANKLLRKSLRYKENDFAFKWIGQIEFKNGNFSEAIKYLQKADMKDPQVVFNISRAHYSSGQFDMGEKYFNLLKILDPNSKYARYLAKMHSLNKTKQK